MKQNLFLLGAGILAFLLVYSLTRARNASLREQQSRIDRKVVSDVVPPAAPPAGMVRIVGTEFTMGTDSELGWLEEKPAHQVRVDDFWIDVTEVTNSAFAKFVDATGYVTTAEKTPSLDEILAQFPPGTTVPPDVNLVAGSLVFTMTSGPVDLQDYSQWWKWTPGANWKHPEGPASDLTDRERHPVVHVSWDDAAAYATWADKRLPTEAEWELAARGGLNNNSYVWGDEPPDDSHIFANIWQGSFPYLNTQADEFVRTAPVGSFPANGFGLFDMSGNVWEWCVDAYDHQAYARRSRPGVTVNPQVKRSVDPRNPRSGSRAQRGGSFLCNDNYCSRYRPSARHGLAPDTGMSHVGFRCVRSVSSDDPAMGASAVSRGVRESVAFVVDE